MFFKCFNVVSLCDLCDLHPSINALIFWLYRCAQSADIQVKKTAPNPNLHPKSNPATLNLHQICVCPNSIWKILNPENPGAATSSHSCMLFKPEIAPFSSFSKLEQLEGLHVSCQWAIIKTLQWCLTTRANTSLRFLQYPAKLEYEQLNPLQLEEPADRNQTACTQDDEVCDGRSHLCRTDLPIPTHLIFQSVWIIAK